MSAFTEANRKAFDDLSSTYNTKPWQHALASQVAEALQQQKTWIGAIWVDPDAAPNTAAAELRDVKLLDYACGTGAITKALGPFVKTIRGIDISENMVKLYNEAARSSGLSEEQALAVVGDLCAEKVTSDVVLKGSEWYEFDIAVIGLGFHHFEYPEIAMKRLAERLQASTGVLVIVDFLPFEDHKKKKEGEEAMGEMQHTIKHNGFTPERLRDMYTDAGFEDFDIIALKQPAVMYPKNSETPVHRTLFIAKGRKSATWWGKFTGWVAGMQDASAGSFRADRKDVRRWGEDSVKSGNAWNTSLHKHKDENYRAAPEDQNAEKKAWTGFQ